MGLTFVESSSVDISSGENSFFVRCMDACSGEMFLGQIRKFICISIEQVTIIPDFDAKNVFFSGIRVAACYF